VYTAITINGKLHEIYLDPLNNASMVGQIYVGRIDALLAGQFSFVDIGAKKNALMNIKTQDQLKKGQPVLVQVYKDATGTKGAYIGLEIRYKGRYSILFKSPRSEIGISQKIKSEAERKRLQSLAQSALPKGFGIIIRTNANGQEPEKIVSEIKHLHQLSYQVSQKAQHAPVPSLIFKPGGDDSNPLFSLLSDVLSDDIAEILIGDANSQITSKAHDSQEIYKLDFESIKQTIMQIMPSLSNRVYHHNNKSDSSILQAHNIPSQIAAALKKTVQLPNGGNITIEQTEACVVIDVNTGRFTGKKDMRTTALETNMEAATAITWHLALRNLSGIIIVDFIDMTNEQDKSALLGAFADELKKDRMKTEIVGITELGLVQLTRKRTREPLARILEDTCPHCGGKGRIVANP